MLVSEAKDVTDVRICFGADVSPAEGGRVLFESGAAIQQAGQAFLVSTDWLQRQGGEAAEGQPDWEAQFDELLAGAVAKGLYVNGFDAIRVPVTQTRTGD